MVAFAGYCNTAALWTSDRFLKRFCDSSFYLYVILVGKLVEDMLHDSLSRIDGGLIMKSPVSNEKALETTGVLALVCLIAGIALQKTSLIYAALFLLFTGLFLRKISYRIASIWLKIAELIGTFNTKIILAVIYFAILTPVAFLYRSFHGDFLCLLRKKSDDKSYWRSAERSFDPHSFEKQW